MRAGSGPLRAASASGSTTCDRELPLHLIGCPYCGDRIIMIRSKKDETYGEIYYKCPNNIQGDPTMCGFIRSEKQYAAFIRKLEAREERGGRVKLAQHGMMEEQGNGDLKREVEALKQHVDCIWKEVVALKMQMLEDKKGVHPSVVIDKAVLFSLCLGIVLGILVTVMLK